MCSVGAHAGGGAGAAPERDYETRSAMLYLERAQKTQVAPERAKLLKQALEMATQGVQSQSGNSKTWFTLGQVYAELGDAYAPIEHSKGRIEVADTRRKRSRNASRHS